MVFIGRNPGTNVRNAPTSNSQPARTSPATSRVKTAPVAAHTRSLRWKTGFGSELTRLVGAAPFVTASRAPRVEVPTPAPVPPGSDLAIGHVSAFAGRDKDVSATVGGHFGRPGHLDHNTQIGC